MLEVAESKKNKHRFPANISRCKSEKTINVQLYRYIAILQFFTNIVNFLKTSNYVTGNTVKIPTTNELT